MLFMAPKFKGSAFQGKYFFLSFVRTALKAGAGKVEYAELKRPDLWAEPWQLREWPSAEVSEPRVAGISSTEAATGSPGTRF